MIVAALALQSCDSFLDRYPITAPNSDTYLSGESQVRSYVNGLYQSLPVLQQWGLGVWEDDRKSDNIVAEIHDRRLNGEFQTSDGEENWLNGYKFCRSANYFFDAYNVSESDENANIISYVGEVYFFRAYWHFYLLQRFGNIPIMNAFWDGNATVAGLQIPQTERSSVAKFILNDLKEAYARVLPRSASNGLRINKEAILIFAMRVALYEGSWEKYHAGTEFSTVNDSKYFFEKVLEYGDMMDTNHGGFKLNKLPSEKEAGDSYADLFRSNDMSSVEEVAFWKKYSSAAGLDHTVQSLLTGGITVMASPGGLTQALIDTYLNVDGTYIDPKDSKFLDFNDTFEGRDPRLTQTVMHSGIKFRNVNEYPMMVRPRLDASLDDKEQEKDIVSPYLHGTKEGQCVTGYHRRLGNDPTYDNGNSETALVILRHAEGLLAYAEAAEELNVATSTVMENTIGALRERVGVPYVVPVLDPNSVDYGYSSNISANLQEIRRERRVELAMQGFRLDDILRWRAHGLIQNKRQLGAYFGDDSDLFKSFTDKQMIQASRIPLNTRKRLDPQANVIPNGYAFRDKRDYLLAIPSSELQLNKKLLQNPGGW